MHAQDEKAAKRNRRFVWISILVVFPLSLVVVAVLLWVGREYSGVRQLKERIANLEKKGYPIDDASLDAQYQANTDPTHTEDWLKLIEILKSTPFVASCKGVPYLDLQTEVPVVAKETWAEEQVSMAFLEEWKAFYAELLRLSIDAKPVRFPIAFQSFQTLLLQTTELRRFAWMLQLKGKVGLRARDSVAIRESIEGLIGLSRVNTGEPILVSHLVSVAIDAIALGLLQEAIRYDAMDESDLKQLLPKVLASIDIGSEWSSIIAGERAMALPLFLDSKKAKAAGVRTMPGRNHDAIFFIDTSQLVLEIPMDRLSEIQSKMGEMKIEERMDRGNWMVKFDTLLTTQLMPNYAMAATSFIRRSLQHRMAAVAIGIRLYEDRYSKLPDSLTELAEPLAAVIDVKKIGPTDESAFGYQRIGSGAKLWGGTNADMFSIPNSPPVSNGSDAKSVGQGENGLWLWELEPRMEDNYPQR